MTSPIWTGPRESVWMQRRRHFAPSLQLLMPLDYVDLWPVLNSDFTPFPIFSFPIFLPTRRSARWWDLAESMDMSGQHGFMPYVWDSKNAGRPLGESLGHSSPLGKRSPSAYSPARSLFT